MISQLIVQSIKCQKIVNNAHHNFLEPNVASSNHQFKIQRLIHYHKWQKAANLYSEETAT